MVTGGIEISYSHKNREDKAKAKQTIEQIIQQSGATITNSYIPTETNRPVDLIYELNLPQEESLDDIRLKILKKFGGNVENVSTLVDE